MTRILDYGGRDAERTETVASLRNLRSAGERRIQVTAGTSDEAAAAEEAGIDLLICLAQAVPEVRQGSRRCFLTAAIDFGGEITPDDLLATALTALTNGADAVITARRLEAIELIATQNGLSPDDLRAALESDGVPYGQFRDRVEDELKIRRLRERQINPQIVVTEEEIETAISGQVSESGAASEFDVSHILVGVSESASGADEQQARALVEQALNALAAGADFAEVAAR